MVNFENNASFRYEVRKSWYRFCRISKHSKALWLYTTDIVALELLFDDALADICFGYIKWYSQREKAGISFEITNEKDRFFWNTLMLSEYHSF